MKQENKSDSERGNMENLNITNKTLPCILKELNSTKKVKVSTNKNFIEVSKKDLLNLHKKRTYKKTY